MSTAEAAGWSDLDDISYRKISPQGAKFVVTEVFGVDGHCALKAVNTDCIPEGQPQLSAEADLGNAVVWSRSMANLHLGTFDVPRATAKLEEDSIYDNRHKPHRVDRIRTRLARFEWVTGHIVGEDQLEELCVPVAKIIKELSCVEVDWEEDNQYWIRQKFANEAGRALDALQNQELRQNILRVTTDDELSKLKPGVVHGDLVPKNIIRQPNGRLALIDAEFGTHDKRPGFTVPRMRDAAYFYHVMRCQYGQSDAAESFLQAMGEEFGDDETWHQEFWTCVIERTLSMYTNFVIKQPSGDHIDERRLNPDNYIATLQTAVDMLKAA